MATEQPNVLLVLADDVGWFDVGAYHRGIMGTRTPNIDRIAAEGVLLTDNYAQASCTAGRAAFITGQLPMQTGLTTVGMPGAKQGIQPEDPTLAELLKPQGYLTAQHGKNHLGDRNEFLPTVHGFDEFYGNLYHLNAEEEPEQPDYPGTTRSCSGCSCHGASWTAGPARSTTRPRTNASAGSAARPSPTPGR
jgi:arylsulfatase A-like enzyme